MKKYFLEIKCTNEECSNLDVVMGFWYEKSETSHPCGICGFLITHCEVVKEQELVEVETEI